MYLITNAVFALMIGFLFSVCFGIILIPFLKKLKANQHVSVYLKESHQKKEGTPTMGGLIFIIPPILSFLLLYGLNKVTITYNTLIVLITFIGYALIGITDDLLIIFKGNNDGLTEKQKIISQLIIAIIFFYLFIKAGNEPLLWIHAINFKKNIGWFYGLFILFLLVASSNAVNLTDGLDGLAGGLSFIAITVFGIITYYTSWLDGYNDIALFLFLLAGSILGFLVFNVSPARIFMGDTGSLALGGILGSIAIETRHELLLAIIGIVFVIETMSCLLQRYYYKLTKKRLFLMAPLHHRFEKKGWQEQDIVRLFWIIGFIGAMLGLLYGVWL